MSELYKGISRRSFDPQDDPEVAAGELARQITGGNPRNCGTDFTDHTIDILRTRYPGPDGAQNAARDFGLNPDDIYGWPDLWDALR